jgi:hypothetical protein
VPPTWTTSTVRGTCASILFAFAIVALPTDTHAQSLAGSLTSMNKQVQEAAHHRYTYIKDPSELPEFVESGALVPISDTEHFYLKEVSYPFARPEVRDFVTLLAERYHEGCGEQLVVTSLTRPKNKQPRNASRRSVHPTGMALDLRRSWNRDCRQQLEQMLLRLEAAGVLDATLERNPYHYHIAVFPRVFRERGETLLSDEADAEYFVVRGDTLSRIARQHGTSVDLVRAYNGLRGTTIYPGQVIKIPTRR